MKPLFIVFEGLDGSGTSTQAGLLHEAWKRQAMRSYLTSEPSNGPVGQMIRQTFKGRLRFQESAELFDRQMAYLFAADRFDHLYNDTDGIIPMLENGISVISTRYIPSSFAYHCHNDNDREFISRLNNDFPKPDLLVYLRNSVEESIHRLKARPVLDSYENVSKLDLASKNYERFIQSYEGTALCLDATRPSIEIHNDILQEISKIHRAL